MIAKTPRLAFIYGSREVLWTGLCRSLFQQEGTIRDTLMHCERLIHERLGWSLREVFASQQFAEEQLAPSLTALQIMLTNVWRERGMEPDVIAARSGGEYAAEYARGALIIEDAIEVACRISRFIRDRRGAGRMLAIRLGLSTTQKLERSSPVRFFLVADAAEDGTIVACETTAVKALARYLLAQQIEYRMLNSTIAPHSPVIDEWESDLLKPLSGTKPNSGLLPYYSATVEGRDNTECYYARLWRAVREPALVGRMLDRLIKDGCNIFLEIGGQPMLATRIHARAAVAGKEVVALPKQRSASLDALMDGVHETLCTLGFFTRPARLPQQHRA